MGPWDPEGRRFRVHPSQLRNCCSPCAWQVLSEKNLILLALIAEFADIVRPFVHEYDTGAHVKDGNVQDNIRTIAESTRLVEQLQEVRGINAKAIHNF